MQPHKILTVLGNQGVQRETVLIQTQSRVKLLSICSWYILFVVG